MLPTKFKINKPFDSGEEAKIRFSGWPPWQTSWISDQKDFSYIWPISQPDASYQVSGPLAFSVKEKKRKINFQDGRQGSHLGGQIRTILAIFDLQVIPMLPAKFRVNWLYSSEEEEKNWKIDFQDGHHGGHLRFPIATIFAIFDLRHLNASYQVWSQLASRFRRRCEK